MILREGYLPRFRKSRELPAPAMPPGRRDPETLLDNGPGPVGQRDGRALTDLLDHVDDLAASDLLDAQMPDARQEVFLQVPTHVGLCPLCKVRHCPSDVIC